MKQPTERAVLEALGHRQRNVSELMEMFGNNVDVVVRKLQAKQLVGGFWGLFYIVDKGRKVLERQS